MPEDEILQSANRPSDWRLFIDHRKIPRYTIATSIPSTTAIVLTRVARAPESNPCATTTATALVADAQTRRIGGRTFLPEECVLACTCDPFGPAPESGDDDDPTGPGGPDGPGGEPPSPPRRTPPCALEEPFCDAINSPLAPYMHGDMPFNCSLAPSFRTTHALRHTWDSLRHTWDSAPPGAGIGLGGNLLVAAGDRFCRREAHRALGLQRKTGRFGASARCRGLEWAIRVSIP